MPLIDRVSSFFIPAKRKEAIARWRQPLSKNSGQSFILRF